MSHKEEALQDIVALIKHHQITLNEIDIALSQPAELANKPSSSVLSKLLGYLGGIFVFAGICIFISMNWANFGPAARVIVTLGTGIVAFLMGLACLYDNKYEKAATPLFLIAACLQPTGILVMLQEYSSGGDPRHGILYMAAYMLIQQGMTFWAKQRAVLAFVAILFGCVLFANLFDMWGLDDEIIGVTIGASLMCIAYALNRSKHLAIAPFWDFVGAVLLLWATFDLLKNTPYELLYLGLTALIIFLSTYVRSRTQLLVGTLAMLIYISYFTAKNFADTLGWPIALILIGLALIALGALALRLNNKFIKSNT